MSYQVLARKWRPQNFKQMVGQEHVLRALMNALDSDRLHHAYLFTGTRGVGKTTIARILAKCLNCETGVTSTPCGECNSCKEIAAGNFLDLIEVDAASRTKVEDTRELLENVQYAPTRARFKVYLIDEVHMLTGHSFNALLKTLEEPPPHVKFLFATTDPQKLPATILSRCLQFNLKRMPVDMISGHLEYLLQQETIKFEDSSLKLLSRAADGSMRDALSLLDQAIAFSGADLTEPSVRDMLGTISNEPLIDLLELIIAGDGASLLQQVEASSSVTPDFDAATDALISLLHQLAVQQVVPDAINDEERVSELAKKITKEEVQLFYQIALQGRRDLPLSPDPRSGFEMLLLRMMSFRPLREGMKLESSNKQLESSVTDSDQADQESKKKTVELKDTNDSNNDAPLAESNTSATKRVEVDVVDSNIQQLTDALDSHQSSSQSDPESSSEVVNEKPEHKETFKAYDSQEKTTQSKQPDSVPPWEDIPPELEEGYSASTVTNEVSNDDPSNAPNTIPSKAENVPQKHNEDILALKDEIKDSESSSNLQVSEGSKPKSETSSGSFSIEDLLLAEDIIEEDVIADGLADQKFDEVNQDSIRSNETNIDHPTNVVEKVEESTTQNKEFIKPEPNQPWYAVVPQLKLSGRANELIKHCLLDSHENDIISLILNKDSEDLLADTTKEEIQAALIKFYGDNVRLDMRIAETSLDANVDKENETPAQRNDRKILETQQQAEHNIETDPFICELQSRFGAQIVPGSVKAKQTIK